MNYSITNLTQVADCNALLMWAAREKADLVFKKLSDERLTTRYSETSLDIEADLQAINAEIAAVEAVIQFLPEGPTKDDNINKKVRLDYRKFLIEARKESYGTVALLEKEVDLNRVERELTEVEVFIAAVEDKKQLILQA